jgi:hypothetical protein
MGTGDRATADPQGHFKLTRLGPGKLSLYARRGDEAVGLDDQRLRGEEHKEVTLKLQPGARVSGVVTWDDGSPAPDMKVTGMQRGGGRGQGGEARTAADGSFTVGPFSGGDVSVAVMPPGERVTWSSMARPEQVDLELVAGEHRTGIKLVAPKRGGSIGGVVLGPDSQPVAGAAVSVSAERDGRAYKGGMDSNRSVSGPDGAFVIEALKKGTYTLWASSPDTAEAQRTGVASGTKDVRIQLGRAASLAGVFVSADGKPVPSYTLVAVPPGKDPAQLRMMRAVDEGGALVVNDARGAFQVARLTAGRYNLMASAADGKAARMEVNVSEGEKKQGLRLVAEQGITVSGRVIEYESGAPLPDLEVHVRLGATDLKAATDAQGAFQIANVPTIAGVMASVYPRERTHIGQGFAIPPARDGRADVGTIKLMKFDPRNPGKGRLGLNFSDQQGKMVINEVQPDSPAARVGIKRGDVLLSVDGKSLTTEHAAATTALRPEDPGKELKLQVQTPGQEPRVVTVKRAM